MRISAAFAEIGKMITRFGLIEILLNDIIVRHYKPNGKDFVKHVLNIRGIDIDTKYRMAKDILKEHYKADSEILSSVNSDFSELIRLRNIIAHSPLYMRRGKSYVVLASSPASDPVIDTKQLVFFANKVDIKEFDEIVSDFNVRHSKVKKALWGTSFGTSVPLES